jgi:hypothetical protein
VSSCCVNMDVCVRKPGPIEEFAMRKAAPKVALKRLNLNGWRRKIFL